MRLAPRALMALALTAGAALSAAPAFSQAETPKPVALTVGPVRIEFGAGAPLTQTVTAFVRNATEATVSARLEDAVIGSEGRGWQPAPFGSTPQSLQGAVSVTPETYDYVPTGVEQQFTFTLTIDPSFDDRPRYGRFVITLTPPEPDGAGQFGVAAAVAIQIVAFGPVEPTALALSLDELTVVQRRPWTTVDELLPDIPGVIGHGPAVLRASGRNTGDAFLDQRTTFEIRRVSPLALLPWMSSVDPEPILKVEMRPRYTIPGQAFVDATTSLIPLDNGSRVDALPLVGFVKVTAIAAGDLGGLEAEPSSITRTYLVFPWSEFLFLFVVYLAQREWRHRKGRKVNMTDAPPPPTLRGRVRDLFRRSPRSGPAVHPTEGGAAPSATEGPPSDDGSEGGPEL